MSVRPYVALLGYYTSYLFKINLKKNKIERYKNLTKTFLYCLTLRLHKYWIVHHKYKMNGKNVEKHSHYQCITFV